MLVDRLTEEQITDNKEIQDGLLIPLRWIPAARIKCECSHCKRLNDIAVCNLENPGTDIISQLGGKVATKLERN